MNEQGRPKSKEKKTGKYRKRVKTLAIYSIARNTLIGAQTQTSGAPRNPWKTNFLAGFPGILPGYPGVARKV